MFLGAAVALAGLSGASGAHAATLLVGPGESIRTVAEASRTARDGDTIAIGPGTYTRDVAVWTQKRLTIRGVGAAPVMAAEGAVAEGKAIWVIRDGDYTVENITFTGVRAADLNGAGIRF